MKILSIIAQKPYFTGSGIYLTETIKSIEKLGHKQELICAAYINDDFTYLNMINDLKVNPVYFDTISMPFDIAGMSDVMPYKSIKYSSFINDKNNLERFINAFRNKVSEIVERFEPDLIICHHLYLLTSIVRDICKKCRVVGICHNTDLRQYIQTDLCREYIKNNIIKLDKLFFPSESHMMKAIKLFGIDNTKCEVIGIGYNNDVFYNKNIDYNLKKNKVLYVGKVSKKKGVLSLIKAFNLINRYDLKLDIIGGAGNVDECNEIISEARKNNLNINFISQMEQTELCNEYNSHELFVLPSFSEGIPMVPIEAIACGCKVVISDLDGVREFYNINIKNALIEYVSLPKLENVDFASNYELKKFENRLSAAIYKLIGNNMYSSPNLSNISWDNIALKLIV